MKIEEVENKTIGNLEPVKESMDIYLPKIKMDNIPNRNGFISLFCGAPGSGKSSLLLSLLRSKSAYGGKTFKHIFYFVPQSSFLSVLDHPLENSDVATVFHELNAECLDALHDFLVASRKFTDEMGLPNEHSLLVIDDFANDLKDADIEKALKKILVKSRHLLCATIITLQGYILCPKSIRKLMTNGIIFKPQNAEEWKALCTEHLAFLSKKDAEALYKYTFDKPYNHLDIDTKKSAKEMFSKNFNQLNIDEK